MSLVTNLSNFATRVATETKALRTLINGNQSDLSALNTSDKTNLVAAINETLSLAGSGGATNLDELTDVVITTPATGHILRHNGTNWVNALGTTYFEVAGAAAAAQAASQPLDSDLTAIAALSTTSFGRALLTAADAAALTANIAAASETVQGKIELATQAETNAGSDDARAVTPLKLQTRLAAYAQPLDSDLTAIAALTTTSYGRAFLALADQAALMTLIASASETVQGKVELATNAETVTGTDTVRATHASGVKAAIDARIDNNAALGSSTTNAPSQAAVKAYADALIAANDAMVFKGVIDASTNPNYPAADRGDTYRISVAGKIGGASGPNVEIGDLIIATADGVASGTQATVGTSWTIVQSNLDGAVTGPASATSGNIATYNGATGKIIQDSGLSASTSTALGTSNTLLPTQNAVKVYADTKQPLDATLTALAGLTTAANQTIYSTGVDTFAMTTLSAFGRTLIDDADATAARTTLGLGSAATQASTAFQTADATLTALAGLTTAANQTIYSTGADTFAMTSLTAFGRSLIDDADAAAGRATLSVYSQAEIGNPETDFVAVFEAGLV